MLGDEPLKLGEGRVCVLAGHRFRLFHRSIGKFRVAARPHECPEERGRRRQRGRVAGLVRRGGPVMTLGAVAQTPSPRASADRQ